MATIEPKLNMILEKLVSLESRLERIEKSCNEMDSHIGFIEGVYGTLRSPLDYISTQVGRLSGISHRALPIPSSSLQ